ncbi:hypothetical protein [Spiroplasma endosymbiont of Apeira syringaria]|uniref:hypothetical protein n=1 Tax=Spiroplasma endosymbiont of Apeira syringaria TaxID=3066307 RepID=UPI0030D55BF3
MNSFSFIIPSTSTCGEKSVKKYQVKTEFYDFLKFKTNNLENSKIEDTIKKMIKEQPVFKEPINTGGKQETILTNQSNSIKSSLLDYKKKNNL